MRYLQNTYSFSILEMSLSLLYLICCLKCSIPNVKNKDTNVNDMTLADINKAYVTCLIRLICIYTKSSFSY